MDDCMTQIIKGSFLDLGFILREKAERKKWFLDLASQAKNLSKSSSEPWFLIINCTWRTQKNLQLTLFFKSEGTLDKADKDSAMFVISSIFRVITIVFLINCQLFTNSHEIWEQDQT